MNRAYQEECCRRGVSVRHTRPLFDKREVPGVWSTRPRTIWSSQKFRADRRVSSTGGKAQAALAKSYGL
jgi:hypothetical protein